MSINGTAMIVKCSQATEPKATPARVLVLEDHPFFVYADEALSTGHGIQRALERDARGRLIAGDYALAPELEAMVADWFPVAEWHILDGDPFPAFVASVRGQCVAMAAPCSDDSALVERYGLQSEARAS